MSEVVLVPSCVVNERGVNNSTTLTSHKEGCNNTVVNCVVVNNVVNSIVSSNVVYYPFFSRTVSAEVVDRD